MDCYAQFQDNRSVVIKYLCKTLTEYESDDNTKFASWAFYNQASLVSAKAPATTVESNAFKGCSALETVELSGTAPVTIAVSAFDACSKLSALIIRSTSMSTIEGPSALSGTKIALGFGAVYVPSNLVDTYKADSKWKNYFIASIDDYPLSDFSTIRDSWTQILAAEADGTYKTKYQLGDTKQISVNGVDALAQIVGFEKDDLKDGSGKAPISWILKGIPTTHRMNATSTTANGWPATEMRTWLTDTILPTLASELQAAIKEVNKTYYDYSSTSTKTSTDKLWLPSAREIFGGTSYEDSGCDYTEFFNSNSARIKYNTSGSAYDWWLRSAYNTLNFRCVNNNGGASVSGATNTLGVAFGFCT